jgi:hypothetical protein
MSWQARWEASLRGIMALLVAMLSAHGAVVTASASNWAKLMLDLENSSPVPLTDLQSDPRASLFETRNDRRDLFLRCNDSTLLQNASPPDCCHSLCSWNKAITIQRAPASIDSGQESQSRRGQERKSAPVDTAQSRLRRSPTCRALLVASLLAAEKPGSLKPYRFRACEINRTCSRSLGHNSSLCAVHMAAAGKRLKTMSREDVKAIFFPHAS